MESTIISIIVFVVIAIGYVIYQESKEYYLSKMRILVKKISAKKPVRERLKVMYKFETDKAVYIAYNTETIQGYDCVNIEIERQVAGKTKIILQEEIFEDSWGAMGGDSFYSLMKSSQSHLGRYIKSAGEFILKEETY